MLLLVLTLANLLVNRRLPWIALSQAELVTVYVMLSVTKCGALRLNMMEILVSIMGYAHYFNTPRISGGCSLQTGSPTGLR